MRPRGRAAWHKALSAKRRRLMKAALQSWSFIELQRRLQYSVLHRHCALRFDSRGRHTNVDIDSPLPKQPLESAWRARQTRSATSRCGGVPYAVCPILPSHGGPDMFSVTGKLPPELAKLVHLEELCLPGNKLFGEPRRWSLFLSFRHFFPMTLFNGTLWKHHGGKRQAILVE